MMKLFARAALFACLVGCSAPLLPHGPVAKGGSVAGVLSPSARAAAATVDAFHAALRRGDTASAAALLAKDALIFESGEVERSKAEYAAHHLGADAEFAKLVTSTVTSRSGFSDGTLAWIATEGRTTGTYRSRSIDAATTETMLLRRIGRAWKIVHIHWSSGE